MKRLQFKRTSEKTIAIAKYCLNGGRSIDEICQRFGMSTRTAYDAMRHVERSSMIKCTRTPSRLTVTNIRKQVEFPVFGRSIASGEVFSFKSIYDAEKIGGFNAGRTRQCLTKGWSHGGFLWFNKIRDAVSRETIEPLIMKRGVTIDECAEIYDTSPEHICKLMGW